MNIYVASKFENKKAVQKAIAALKQDGHTVTHDWTGEDAAGKSGEELGGYLMHCAEMDIRGVLKGNGLLLIDHDPAPKGGYTEFGMAIAKHRITQEPMCIVVLNGLYKYGIPQNIFFTLLDVVHVQTLDEARDVFRSFQKRYPEK